LGLDPDRRVVLASFSGHGLELPYATLERSGDFALLAPPREPPGGLRYEDLVAAADVVVSKPGYGIVSECAANGTALLYSSRGNFVEYDVFVREMPKLLRVGYLSQEALVAGDWGPAIDRVLSLPPPPEQPRIDGADVVARRILEVIER